MNPIERRIWELEQYYWEVLNNQDLVSYLNLWHEDLVVWPSWSSEIVRKDEIQSALNFVKQGRYLEFEYSLELHSVKEYKNVVISIYVISYGFKNKVTDEIESAKSSRITHTWQKEGDSWVIIGGMNTVPY